MGSRELRNLDNLTTSDNLDNTHKRGRHQEDGTTIDEQKQSKAKEMKEERKARHAPPEKMPQEFFRVFPKQSRGRSS